eukprot:3502307-Prorocentrum_lima.AAC.1
MMGGCAGAAPILAWRPPSRRRCGGLCRVRTLRDEKRSCDEYRKRPLPRGFLPSRPKVDVRSRDWIFGLKV